MKKLTTLALYIFVTTAGMFSTSTLSAQPLCPWQHHRIVTNSVVYFREDMRKLWEDHIVWTRNVIFNIIDDLPGTNEAVARLLQNQDDIGNAIKPFYGNAAGDQLTALLYGHITIAASLLTALNNNDAAGIAQYNQDWIENADSIALFLSNANPHWDYVELQTMLHEHLNLTAIEATARHTQDYAGDVIAYDNVHISILEMADMLSCGIIRQFPWHFIFNNNREMNLDVNLSNGEIVLEQNSPNPFTDQTEIAFYIPDEINDARIKFYNSLGALIKTVVLTERGFGTLTIHADNLSEGLYTYTIEADGRVIDTKTMMH